MKKNKPLKLLKPRLSAHKLKPEQVHKNVKTYDRKKSKRRSRELLKTISTIEKNGN